MHNEKKQRTKLSLTALSLVTAIEGAEFAVGGGEEL
jgi:hypothetical protein